LYRTFGVGCPAPERHPTFVGCDEFSIIVSLRSIHIERHSGAGHPTPIFFATQLRGRAGHLTPIFLRQFYTDCAHWISAEHQNTNLAGTAIFLYLKTAFKANITNCLFSIQTNPSMNHKPIVIALTMLCLASTTALAQDASFTQWEHMPLQFNPALTGNYNGLVRLRGKYRNQWRSLLGKNSYKTSAISAEYKFPSDRLRQISVGALLLGDRAGSLDFRNTTFKISTSIIQHLGKPDNFRHTIGIGLNVGLTHSTFDVENAQWPGMMPPADMNDKTNYADVSAGLLWQYRSNTHFSCQLGSALHHINRPNVSFSDTSVFRLYHRFNLHGHVEIPVVRTLSILPSFLYSDQGPGEQLLFGINNRWYPSMNNPNFVQLGLFAKTAKSFDGTTDIDTYVLSATVSMNSVLVGFSFDRYQSVESSAYEFSVGYTFRSSFLQQL
jgi:type IX secretion system PorP/SprF family membrane protein